MVQTLAVLLLRGHLFTLYNHYEVVATTGPTLKMRKVSFRLSGLLKGTQLMNGGIQV